VLHQLILAYSADGDNAAGRVYAATANKTEAARQLAYRLYTLCERRSWAEEARAYNDVVTGWSGIETAAARAPKGDRQGSLFATEENR
jgi:putative DNA methylase